MLPYCLPFTLIIINLHTQTPHDFRMGPIDFGEQRSRSHFMDLLLMVYVLHNSFSITPIFMKLHAQTPSELKMCPNDFGVKRSKVKVTIQMYIAGFETYFFSHSQTLASGINLNSQIAVSNSQLVFPTFEQFLTLRCGMAIVSWGWNLVHRSPLRWQRTCWRPHSSFLRLKKYFIFSAIAVTWQDSESVLRGASTFPLLLL